MTSWEKIFVCGDAGPNLRTVAHAIGSGKRTAMSIDSYFHGWDIEKIKSSISIGSFNTICAALYRNGRKVPGRVMRFSDLNVAYFSTAEAIKARHVDLKERLKGFGEVNLTGDVESIQIEAARCFSCGICNECGNCHLFCPDMSIIKEIRKSIPDFNADYCKGCGICARECPRGIIEMMEEIK